jgi:hypothetical protein
VDAAEAKHCVDDYYRILKEECVPIGHAINPNIAIVTGFSVHPDAEEAKRRGMDGFRFFGYALGHHYIFGSHKPGRTDIWKRFEEARGALPDAGANRGIGTPDQLRDHLQEFADAGVDQVIFIQQGGKNRHEHICESLELFARAVMPGFKEGEAEREKRKLERLAPALEKAMARKQWMRALSDDEIPDVHALGRQIVEQIPPDAARGGSIAVPLSDPAAH